MEPELRTKLLMVKLTESEFLYLKDLARTERRTMSEIVRMRTLPVELVPA